MADFAPLELSAALEISHDAARALIADALDLTIRLPRLWALLQAGRVEPWRARRITAETRDLSLEAADHADRLVCAVPDRVHRVDAKALIDEARLYHDPDRAAEDERHQLTHRGVWLHRGTRPVTTDVLMTMDTPDALAFHDTVSDLATTLGCLGDPDTLDIRRARAAGPSTPTTRPRPCVRPPSCATTPACSRAAAATPAGPTSTTSTPTSRPR